MALNLIEYPKVDFGTGGCSVWAGFSPMLWKFWRKDYQLTKIASDAPGDLRMIVITNDPDADAEILVGDQLYISDLTLDSTGQIIFRSGIYEVEANMTSSLPAAQYGFKLKNTHNSAGDTDLETDSTGVDYVDRICWMNVLKRNYKVITKWRKPDIPSDILLGYYAFIFREEFSYSPAPNGYLEIDGQAIAKTLIKPEFVVGSINMHTDILTPFMIGLNEPINIFPIAQGIWDEGDEEAVPVEDLFADENGTVYPVHAAINGGTLINYCMNLIQPAKFLTSFDVLPWYPGKALPLSYFFDPIDPPADNTYAITLVQYDISGVQINMQTAALNGLGDSIDTIYLDEQFTLSNLAHTMNVYIGEYSGGVYGPTHSEIKKVIRKTCSPNDLHLIWRNKLGGISNFVFGYNQDGIFEEQNADRLIRVITAYAESITASEFEALQELNSKAYTGRDTQYGQYILMQNADETYTQVVNRVTNNEWRTRSSRRTFIVELQTEDIIQKLP